MAGLDLYLAGSPSGVTRASSRSIQGLLALRVSQPRISLSYPWPPPRPTCGAPEHFSVAPRNQPSHRLRLPPIPLRLRSSRPPPPPPPPRPAAG